MGLLIKYIMGIIKMIEIILKLKNASKNILKNDKFFFKYASLQNKMKIYVTIISTLAHSAKVEAINNKLIRIVHLSEFGKSLDVLIDDKRHEKLMIEKIINVG